MTCGLRYGAKTVTVPVDTCGWALFGGVDGEDPCFLSFHAHEADARKAQEAHHAEYSTDTDVVPAMLTLAGLVCSNDVRLNSHAELAVVALTEGAVSP